MSNLGIGEGTYCPLPLIEGISTNTIDTSTQSTITVKGIFLDQLDDAQVTPINNNGGSITVDEIRVISYEELEIKITSNNVPNIYSIELLGICGNITLPNIEVKNITTIIPNITGSVQEQWVKSGSNNSANLGLGSFEASNNGGNGWNEYAYFGGITANSTIELHYDVTRLNANSTAYGFIRINSTNISSTGGVPRLYHNNGNNLIIYHNNGNISTTCAVNDSIKIKISNNLFEVSKNGNVIVTDNSTYSIANIFVTFTAYRVLGVSNIRLIHY